MCKGKKVIKDFGFEGEGTEFNGNRGGRRQALARPARVLIAANSLLTDSTPAQSSLQQLPAIFTISIYPQIIFIFQCKTERKTN